MNQSERCSTRIITIAESSLRQWQRNGFGPWAALDKSTGQWIGRMGLDYQGARQWKGVEVLWYALDYSVWQAIDLNNS